MTSRLQALLLLLFSVALLRLGTSELLLRFVRASARPWVLLAGAAVLVLAVWSLVAAFRSEKHEHADTPDEHGHGAASRSAWLVVLPVIAVLVIGPPALGEYTANRREPIAIHVEEPFAPLPKSDPVALRMFDFALRAASNGRATIATRTVVLTGFVARRADGGFALARLVITCCAADASPVIVTVRTSAPVPVSNSWVRVTGRYAGQDPSDPDVALLTASRIVPIAAPAEPYD